MLRKWYVPQTLLYLYGWKTYEYTNYARDNYQRYVNLFLEGDRYYDLYGNYITGVGASTTGVRNTRSILAAASSKPPLQ